MTTARSRTTTSLTAALGVSAMLALAACSSDPAPAPKSSSGNDKPASSAPAETTAPAEDESPSADDSSTPASEDADSGDLTETKASSDQKQDKDMGHTFEATGVALGYKGTGQWVEAPGNNTYVAVKVKGTAGSKFITGLSCTNFRLWDDKATRGQSDTTSLNKDHMTEVGLTPLERISSGKSGEGWCLYYTEAPTADNLTLEYSRPARKDSNGTVYPEVSEKMKITPQG